jgi:hypothetical protein
VHRTVLHLGTGWSMVMKSSSALILQELTNAEMNSPTSKSRVNRVKFQCKEECAKTACTFQICVG